MQRRDIIRAVNTPSISPYLPAAIASSYLIARLCALDHVYPPAYRALEAALYTVSTHPTTMKLNIALLACSAVSLCSSLVSGEELSSRLSKFHTLASKNNGIVPLTSSLYDELIQDTPTSPRDYSVSIILTALNPKFGCQPCITFDKEHKEAARQWWIKSENKKSKEKQMRHVFAVLDFEKGQDIFKRVGSRFSLSCVTSLTRALTLLRDIPYHITQLGLNTAPLGQLFLPNQAQPLSYDFNKLCAFLRLLVYIRHS